MQNVCGQQRTKIVRQLKAYVQLTSVCSDDLNAFYGGVPAVIVSS